MSKIDTNSLLEHHNCVCTDTLYTLLSHDAWINFKSIFLPNAGSSPPNTCHSGCNFPPSHFEMIECEACSRTTGFFTVNQIKYTLLLPHNYTYSGNITQN